MLRIAITFALFMISNAVLAQAQSRLYAEASFRCDSFAATYLTPNDSARHWYSGQKTGRKNVFTGISALQYDSSTIYTRNPNGTPPLNLRTVLYQTFDANNRTRLLQEKSIFNNTDTYADYIYDGNGDTTLLVRYYYDINSKKTSTTIDSYQYALPGKLSHYVHTVFDPVLPPTTITKDYNYNSNGDVVYYHYQDPLMKENLEYTYIYTGNTLTETDSKEQRNFVTYNTKTFYYYTSSRLDSIVYLTSHNSSPAYDTAGKMTYSYNTLQLLDTSKYFYYYTLSGYEPASGIAYDYDANKNTTAVTSLRYNTILKTLQNDTRKLYTYNSSNDVIHIESRKWDGSAWQLPAFGFTYNYHYETFFPTGINIAAHNVNTLKIYPVPSAAGIINIQMHWTEPQSFNAAIYDMQGRIIKHWQEVPCTTYTRSISTAGLQPGNYILKLNGSKETATKQFIVQ